MHTINTKQKNFCAGRRLRQQTQKLMFINKNQRAAMLTEAGARPWLRAVTVMVPDWPGMPRTTAITLPENALRSAEVSASMSMGLPLSVATSTPGPLTSKRTRLPVRGTQRPALSAMATLTNDRSSPSAAMAARSAEATRAAAGPVVTTVSAAHGRPSR